MKWKERKMKIKQRKEDERRMYSWKDEAIRE